MQFQYNSDYPSHSEQEARAPLEFPPAQPVTCARITTRVYHPLRQTVATVQNVLVRTNNTRGGGRRQQQSRRRPSVQQDLPMGDATMGESDNMSSSSSCSSSSSASSSYSNVSMEQVTTATSSSNELNDDDNNNNNAADVPDECAYWIQRTVREAIYGRVLLAVVLKKRRPATMPTPTITTSTTTATSTITTAATTTGGGTINADWEVTAQHCAVKEMSWQHIRRERDRLAEDPVKEVSAMQFLKEWHAAAHFQRQQQQPLNYKNNNSTNTTDRSRIHSSRGEDSVTSSFRSMLETNVMMPLDLLSDEGHLYSIMPYCNGGELFELLDMNERFTEPEARYWMNQVLNGLESLQHAGICHRDLSLENLLVHESGALIIDMGMCLRLPTTTAAEEVEGNNNSTTPLAQQQQKQQHLSTSFNNLTILNSASGSAAIAITSATVIEPRSVATTPPPFVSDSSSSNHNNNDTSISPHSVRGRRRYMVTPQGTCGKWIYMSPEIYKNSAPFDGYAVDMWAAGVILFLMLMGFPPWDRACQTDERFKYMSAGYLVQMLTEWEMGISPDAMDLLQRMLFLDPKDRLSLDQVRAHPWMVNGPCLPPDNVATSTSTEF